MLQNYFSAWAVVAICHRESAEEYQFMTAVNRKNYGHSLDFSPPSDRLKLSEEKNYLMLFINKLPYLALPYIYTNP